MSTIRILGIHGLGDHRDGQWIDDWEKAIVGCVSQSGVKAEFVPFSYDEIYEEIDISTLEASTAFVKLAASGITSGASNLIDNIGGLSGVDPFLRREHVDCSVRRSIFWSGTQVTLSPGSKTTGFVQVFENDCSRRSAKRNRTSFLHIVWGRLSAMTPLAVMEISPDTPRRRSTCST